jgi:phenol hydroxylase P0 protein
MLKAKMPPPWPPTRRVCEGWWSSPLEIAGNPSVFALLQCKIIDRFDIWHGHCFSPAPHASESAGKGNVPEDYVVEVAVTENAGHSADNDLTCFVRVRGERKRFIEFDFAVGSPDLAMEMIMPKELFGEFCRRHRAVMLNQEQSDTIDAERTEWRYGDRQPGRLV